MLRSCLTVFAFLAHSSCARDIAIRSDQDLLTAINTVRPGDVIHLYRDTVYYLQNVELTRSGQPNLPITLNGERGTKITSDNTGLVIRGSFWKIQNIEFENSQNGILVLGNNNTFKSLSFHDLEEEGLILRGDGNLVRNSVFNAASHGVVVSGRHNVLVKNSITCMVTSITATPRSCCGRLEGNTFNGLLNILGGDYSIIKNIANSDVSVAGQRNNFKGNVINGRLDVSGCGNTFFGNTAGTSDFTSTCYNWDDGENHFGGSLGTVVSDTGNGGNYHPGQSGQPGSSGYPGGGGNHKPGRPGQTGVSGYPQGSHKPSYPSGSGYPQGNYQPGQPGQPGGNYQPGRPGQPGGNYQPGQPGQPGGNYQPGQPGQPGGNYRPNRPNQPSAVSYPSGNYKPGRPGNGNYQPGHYYVHEHLEQFGSPGNLTYPVSNGNRPSINFAAQQ